jgi:hypothetical protein
VDGAAHAYPSITLNHLSIFPKSLSFAFDQIRIKFTTELDDLTTFFDFPASPVFNFFFVGGITFDILGAVLALTSVLALRKMANTIDEVKSNVCGAVWHADDAIHVCSRRGSCAVPARFADDLPRILHIVDHHSNVNFGVFLAFNAGMAFEFMSACTLGATTNQSVGTWVFVVLLRMVIILFFVTRTHWGIFL